MIRVLFSKEILLELVLDRQFLEQKSYSFLEPRHSQEIKTLRDMVDNEDELRAYVLPVLAQSVETLIKHFTGRNQCEAQRGVDEIITNIRCSYMCLEQDSILEAANAIFRLPNYPQNANFADALCLLCAKELHLEAIVTRYPDTFSQIININSPELSGFNGKIFTPSQFIEHARAPQESDNEEVDEIVVYTPKSQQKTLRPHKDLRSCVTPLDFAYALHEDIGHQCSGAKVNGNEFPLNACLKSGDIVEIKKEGNGPSEEWLDFVGTRRAKAKINYWFRHQTIKQGWKNLEEKLGRDLRKFPELLDIVKEIAKHKYSTLDELAYAAGSDMDIEKILEKIKKKLEEVDAQVERGEEILGKELLSEVSSSHHSRQKLRTIAKKLKCRSRNELLAKVGSDQVSLELLKELWQEEDSTSWRVALCCKPLPGDGESIVAVGSRLHRSDCEKIKDLDSKHIRPLPWNWNHCIATLSLKTIDWPGTFQTVLKELAEMGLWADVRNVTNHSNKTSTVHLLIFITSKNQMAQIENQVKNLPGIIQKEVQWARITPANDGWTCSLSDKPESFN